MPKHPRLIRRGTTFWHRAAIPVDIKGTYPKTEETFSLRTKDPREALILVRKAAAEVDQRFANHRRHLLISNKTPVPELSKAQLARIEEIYYSHLLDEDEQARLNGFYEEDAPQPSVPIPSFEEHNEGFDMFGDSARYMLARGKSDTFYRGEVKEVLTWDGLGVVLAAGSPSWKLAERALQAAVVKAQDVVARRSQGDVIETPEVSSATADDVSGPRASGVRRDWIAEKANGSWVAKTKHEHETWTQHFLTLIGDRPLGAYAKADARAFKQALQKLPPNWSKHKSLRDLTFPQAVARSAELALTPMSDKNINKLLGFVGSFWIWAAEQYEEVSSNPFKGLQIKIRSRARDDRDPFTIEQLQRIFNAPIYRGCRSEKSWKYNGSIILSDSGRYWVPLISLFSGARLGEIIQLRVNDIIEEKGILHFELLDEEEDQRLKNENSRRRIPVHPELLELGLGDLLARRRKNGSERLFPDLKMGKDGYYSSPFSKHYGRFLRSVGAKGTKTTFHSFRHNFEDACRDSEMPPEVMNTLQGHGEGGMAARYGKGYVLRKLDEWIRKISYEGLDLAHLRSAKALQDEPIEIDEEPPYVAAE